MLPSLDDKCLKYIQSRFSETKEYIRRELDVLEAIENQRTANRILKQLPERIRMVVNNNSNILKQNCAKHRPEYMNMVSKALQELSTTYKWSGEEDFSDSVAKTLKNLSKEFEYDLDKAA